MRTIQKYKLNPGKNIITMPKGASILTAQWQDKEASPVIWVEFLEERGAYDIAKREEREIYVFNTGYDIEEKLFLKYISTIQFQEYEWHIFEKVGIAS